MLLHLCETIFPASGIWSICFYAGQDIAGLPYSILFCAKCAKEDLLKQFPQFAEVRLQEMEPDECPAVLNELIQKYGETFEVVRRF